MRMETAWKLQIRWRQVRPFLWITCAIFAPLFSCFGANHIADCCAIAALLLLFYGPKP